LREEIEGVVGDQSHLGFHHIEVAAFHADIGRKKVSDGIIDRRGQRAAGQRKRDDEGTDHFREYGHGRLSGVR